MHKHEAVVRVLTDWNYNTREKKYKYSRITSEGIFIVNGYRYNYTSVPATEQEWLENEAKRKKLQEKPKPRHIEKGEKVLNPWKK